MEGYYPARTAHIRAAGRIQGRHRAAATPARICWLLLTVVAAVRGSEAQPSSGTTLVIFPLEDNTGLRDLSWIGEGVALSLTDALAACGITAVDRDERILLTEQADLPPGSPLSRASMIRVGQTAAVDGLVYGTYSGSERDLKLSLRYLDLRSLRISGEVAAHGPLPALPESENELAWTLSGIVAPGAGCTRTRVATRKRLVPNSAYTLYIGSLQTTDEEEQLRLAERSVGIYGAFAAARYRLGRHYALRGDCPSAIRHLEPVRATPGVPPDALLMLGTCMLRGGEIDGAIQVLSRHLAFARGPETLNNLGVAYLRKGELSVAAEYLSEARRSSPSDAAVTLNLVILHHLQQSPVALVDLIRSSPGTTKGSAQLQLLYGDALAALGETAAAEEAFARAKLLGSDPLRLRTEDLRSWTRLVYSSLAAK